MADGPLEGVRVLDLTHVWAGPLGTRILADLGAEVVKIESRTIRGTAHAPTPGTGIYLGGESGTDHWNRQGIFVKLNRNKQSVCLDLKARAGRATFLDLVREADVVIENFSARVMAGFDLGFDALRAANDRIIYVTMPGYGSSGPYSEWVAFGPSVEPMTGLSAIMGYGPDEPRNTAIALPDAIAGVASAAAVVTALNRRKASGRGEMIELSLHEAAVSFQGDFLIERQLGGNPRPIGNLHPAHAYSAVVRAAGEDAWVAVSCRTDAERARCETILAECADTLDKQALADRLQRAGIAAGAVNAAPDYLDDPQIVARRFFVDLGREDQPSAPYPGLPVVLDERFEHSDWRSAPRLGEHNRAVLKDWLGYDDARIDALEGDGVLADRPTG